MVLYRFIRVLLGFYMGFLGFYWVLLGFYIGFIQVF